MRRSSRRRSDKVRRGKRAVLFMLLTAAPLSLQGCAILGFLGSILSAVAPLLGPAMNLATSIIGVVGAAGGGGGGAQQVAPQQASQQFQQTGGPNAVTPLQAAQNGQNATNQPQQGVRGP